MPRYVSPGRTPSPSRSPSRTTSRDRRVYTDGVYTPSPSPSPPPAAHSRSRSRRRASPSRSPSRSRSRSRPRAISSGRSRTRSVSSDSRYYSYSDDDSRYTRRSRSRDTVRTGGTRSTKERLSSILDTSESTGKEKAANAVKTSLVMLGAIGAASLAAHKLWPKGITYGEKDDWEIEHEEKEASEKKKLKGKLREGRDAIEDERRGGGGKGRGDRDRDRDRDPDRERYLRERRRERPRLPHSMDGDDGAAFWDKRARIPNQRRYDDDGDDYPYPPGPRDQRYLEGPAPGPSRRPPSQQPRYIEAAPVVVAVAPQPPLPPAPAPPRSFADSAPLVVPSGASRRDSEGRGPGPGRGRYYIDKDTIVVPSSGERTYVIQRDAPPGQRVRARGREGDRDGEYYR